MLRRSFIAACSNVVLAVTRAHRRAALETGRMGRVAPSCHQVVHVGRLATIPFDPRRCRLTPGGSGPAARWLEPAAHNGLVAGSSPAGPTNDFSGFRYPVLFAFSSTNETTNATFFGGIGRDPMASEAPLDGRDDGDHRYPASLLAHAQKARRLPHRSARCINQVAAVCRRVCGVTLPTATSSPASRTAEREAGLDRRYWLAVPFNEVTFGYPKSRPTS